MHGNESALVFRQRHTKPVFNNLQRLKPDREFFTVHSLDLPQKRILDLQPMTVTVDGEVDMICQRDVYAVVQLLAQHGLRITDHFVGAFNIFHRNVRQQCHQLL
ncbi:hypothetical protein D3C86_1674730 [compost metagenome]